jgi:hypothetical protein
MRVWVMSAIALLALSVQAEAAPPSRSGPKPKPAAPTAAPRKPAITAATPTVSTERRAPVGEAKIEGASPQVATEVVKTEEAKEGVKTYTFGAQEVEGRLRSPQILYFLRRVRAEFDPQPLGHRSFLLELRDTRRHPAL